MSGPIYLDHNATTPIAEEVIEAMLGAMRESWGNPSSAHVYGHSAREAIDNARTALAELLGCDSGELVFTGGGTEADNMALVGVAEAAADRGRHLVISNVEHAAVDRAAAYLEQRGWTVSRIPVDTDGRVDAHQLLDAVREDTVLVSLMHANNETGVLQPVREVADGLREREVILHTDAAQSVGKLPLSVDELGVDLLTVAGHKFYGPKGVGALFLRRGVQCAPLLRGAAHESGRRAGTENTPAIVGLGVACRLALAQATDHVEQLAGRRDRLAAAIRESCPDVVVHGERVARLPNTLSIAIPGAPGHLVVPRLTGVATAAGAACHSGVPKPSSVLRAMGVPDELAVCTLRLTLGRGTSDADVELAAERIVDVARDLRAREGAAR